MVETWRIEAEDEIRREESRTIAKKGLAMGYLVSDIATLTGLTPDEIETLKAEQ